METIKINEVEKGYVIIQFNPTRTMCIRLAQFKKDKISKVLEVLKQYRKKGYYSVKIFKDGVELKY